MAGPRIVGPCGKVTSILIYASDIVFFVTDTVLGNGHRAELQARAANSWAEPHGLIAHEKSKKYNEKGFLISLYEKVSTE